MEPQKLRELGAALRPLVLSPETTEADHAAAMRAIGTFNDSMLGLLRFSGETPWERHRADELLLVLRGSVELVLLPESGEAEHRSLPADSIYVVPPHVWHRQIAAPDTTILFATAPSGDDVSWSEDPRSAD